jgi:hypothetical protein
MPLLFSTGYGLPGYLDCARLRRAYASSESWRRQQIWGVFERKMGTIADKWRLLACLLGKEVEKYYMPKVIVKIYYFLN